MNEFIPLNCRVINSIDEINSMLMTGGKLVLLCDEIPAYLNNPMYGSSCIKANSLLPSYEAVSCFLDNNIAGFQQAYFNQLSTEENSLYFITIISALMNNIPIGFIFGNEEIEQRSGLLFLQFFEMRYGVHITMNPMEQSFMHRQFVPNNINLLYANNLLTPQEFLYIYPLEIPIDRTVMEKLYIDMRPPVNPTDIEGIIRYFDNFRRLTKKANKVLEDPIQLC